MNSYQDHRENLYERSVRETEERKRQEQQEAEALKQEAEKVVTPTEQPKDTNNIFSKDFEHKKPEEIFSKNLIEARNAPVRGVTQFINSVGSVGKFLDKDFYKPNDPNNPYKYDGAHLIKKQPILETQWGKLVADFTEFALGYRFMGKMFNRGPLKAFGAKDLKAKNRQLTRVGEITKDAIQGAAYDGISNLSQEYDPLVSDISKKAIDLFPNTFGFLEPIANTDTMSPALKTVLNQGDGVGTGIMVGEIFRAIGVGSRKIRNKLFGGKKPVADDTTKLVENSRKVEYDALEAKVLKGAKQIYEKAEYRKYVTKVQKSSQGRPLRKDQFLKKNKGWDSLDPKVQRQKMLEFAEKQDLPWERDMDPFSHAVQQGKANKALELEQLEMDLSTGNPRKNPAYYKGGDISDNQALVSSDNPTASVRDMIEIRNNPTQKNGTPRGVMTEANIRRVEYTAPGMMLDEINAVSKKLKASPSYQRMFDKATSSAMKQDMAKAYKDIIQFLDDSGHSRLSDVPLKTIEDYLGPKKPLDIGGVDIPILNQEQINAVDVITGQLLLEARDLAKSSLTIGKSIDVTASGSLLDGILARYSALARLRKETSGAVSARLRGFRSGAKKELISKASDAVANEVATFKQVLKTDPSNELLEGFLHFTAESNGSKQTFKDFQEFFRRKLRGYKQGSIYQRNAIVNEMMTMGVNSMLSGPKTPVRALVGTGLGTVMRPVATILGAFGKSNDSVLRGAYANLGGMLEARNEAFTKAIADFKAYGFKEDGFRGYIKNRQDSEWQGMMDWAAQHGTLGDKAQAKFANSLREMNKLSIFNYGPRIMRSMDTFFSQIIGRGRQRQLAFNEVYDKYKAQGIVVSDADLDRLVRESELKFESKVFTADGQLSDEMAKFAADEAKLTQELRGAAKDLDKLFDQTPFIRPFLLFARTGVNALTMTSKYTPILNSFIDEHVAIMTKNFDDPSMAQYGIRTAEDLEIAKATMRGRMAIGYGFTGLASWAALNGYITGNGPPDRDTRNSWMKISGWQPRSIKVNGSYVSYESLEPFNGILSMIADIADAQKVMGDEWTGNWFGKVSHIISANVINKSFLAGLLQLSDLLTSKGADAPRVAANFVNAQIPLSGMRNEIGKILSPGMRELESGFWQSIQNRNLWADVFLKEGKLPYRYDVLNGEPLRDWEPITRLVNAILPINLNIGTTNETRELLMRSGLNLKQTFNTGPNGENLEGMSDLKSKFNFYMGQQNSEAMLAEVMTDQVKASILRMEEDRANGRSYEPRNTEHGVIIHQVFKTAKATAWNLLLEDPEYGATAQALEEAHNLKKIQDNYRIGGDFEADRALDPDIEKIKNINNLPK
jgi:hypothetical protein